MAAEIALKDFFEVYSRLFDHRPAIKSEVNFFVKEFEERRKNQELVRLQQSLEQIREINEKLVAACSQQLQTNLPPLHTAVDDAVVLCQKIIDGESDSNKTDWLTRQRMAREQAWTQYLDAMCKRTAAVDEEFEAEVKLVEHHYTELNHQQQQQALEQNSQQQQALGQDSQQQQALRQDSQQQQALERDSEQQQARTDETSAAAELSS